MNKEKPPSKHSGNFNVVIPVYGIGIMFSFNQTPKKIQSIIKRSKVKGMPDIFPEVLTTVGTTYVNGSTTALIVMKEWPDRASKYNTLQHEIFHACDLTLRNIGFELNNGSHEAWAYMIGHVTEKIYQILWDKKYH